MQRFLQICITWATVLLLIPCQEVHAEFLSDVTECVNEWIRQSPEEIQEINHKLSAEWLDKPHQGLQYALMLEPYLVYLISLHNPDALPYGYVPAFVNYCNRRTGVDVFISCMKKRESWTKKRSNLEDATNILDNIYNRYCDDSASVKKTVLAALLSGSTSKVIRKLSDLLIATNNSVICSDVVESSFHAAVQLVNEEKFLISQSLDAISSAVGMFARCLIVSTFPGRKSLTLEKHIGFVLLDVIGSNVADISRSEMSVMRQTVSFTGFGNVLRENRRTDSCTVTGTHKLVYNDVMTLTGTIMYERIRSGSLLPYLAAVHIRFPIFDDRMNQIGHVSYSSGMDSALSDDIVTMWWEKDQFNARAAHSDHGITIQKVGEFIEVTDSRTGTYILLHKVGKLISLVIRMFTTYMYQSVGLLLEPTTCHQNGQTAVYAGVLPTSRQCRSACHYVNMEDVDSMCQRDCLMSDRVELISKIYKKLGELLVIASLKDGMFETISGSEMTTTQINILTTHLAIVTQDNSPVVYDHDRLITTDISLLDKVYKIDESSTDTYNGKIAESSTLPSGVTDTTSIRYTATDRPEPTVRHVTRWIPPPKKLGSANNTPGSFHISTRLLIFSSAALISRFC